MLKNISGIHHISSITRDPQKNLDFYREVLGLKLVKKTVNFDSPSIYHLYFGDSKGRPGTIITFFPTPDGIEGRIGSGQVEITSYAVPRGSLDFWKKRLSKFNINYKETERLGRVSLQFKDGHGLKLEIIEGENIKSSDREFEEIKKGYAIKGFFGAVLDSHYPKKTCELLDRIMRFEKTEEDEDYIRFKSKGKLGNVIDVKKNSSPNGKTAVGTVHHIAFRAKDINEQIGWKKLLEEEGYNVTEIKDRKYFTSIYFRGKGGILFEIATDGPGFLIDEDYENLGKELKLPEQYEKNREELVKGLKPLVY